MSLEEHAKEGEGLLARTWKAIGLSGLAAIVFGVVEAGVARLDAAVLVVGSRGLGDLGGFTLGRVSHDVAVHARWPVLIASSADAKTHQVEGERP
jgi:nucleotide-binding universal stress UspA family protein